MAVDFDDAFIYKEITKAPMSRHIPFINVNRDSAIDVFRMWDDKGDKIPY